MAASTLSLASRTAAMSASTPAVIGCEQHTFSMPSIAAASTIASTSLQSALGRLTAENTWLCASCLRNVRQSAGNPAGGLEATAAEAPADRAVGSAASARRPVCARNSRRLEFMAQGGFMPARDRRKVR